MTVTEQLRDFKRQNPTFGTARIAKIFGMKLDTVRHHLDPRRHQVGGGSKKREQWKRDWVAASGGGCAICGYNFCMSALSFHHLDKKTKSFAVSQAPSYEEGLKETKKCILLCNRCHSEHEAGLTPIPRVHRVTGTSCITTEIKKQTNSESNPSLCISPLTPNTT